MIGSDSWKFPDLTAYNWLQRRWCAKSLPDCHSCQFFMFVMFARWLWTGSRLAWPEPYSLDPTLLPGLLHAQNGGKVYIKPQQTAKLLRVYLTSCPITASPLLNPELVKWLRQCMVGQITLFLKFRSILCIFLIVENVKVATFPMLSAQIITACLYNWAGNVSLSLSFILQACK